MSQSPSPSPPSSFNNGSNRSINKVSFSPSEPVVRTVPKHTTHLSLRRLYYSDAEIEVFKEEASLELAGIISPPLVSSDSEDDGSQKSTRSSKRNLVMTVKKAGGEDSRGADKKKRSRAAIQKIEGSISLRRAMEIQGTSKRNVRKTKTRVQKRESSISLTGSESFSFPYYPDYNVDGSSSDDDTATAKQQRMSRRRERGRRSKIDTEDSPFTLMRRNSSYFASRSGRDSVNKEEDNNNTNNTNNNKPVTTTSTSRRDQSVRTTTRRRRTSEQRPHCDCHGSRRHSSMSVRREKSFHDNHPQIAVQKKERVKSFRTTRPGPSAISTSWQQRRAASERNLMVPPRRQHGSVVSGSFVVPLPRESRKCYM